MPPHPKEGVTEVHKESPVNRPRHAAINTLLQIRNALVVTFVNDLDDEAKVNFSEPVVRLTLEHLQTQGNNIFVAMDYQISVNSEFFLNTSDVRFRSSIHQALRPGVEIALIRLSGLSKNVSGQVDRPAEVIRRTSR